MEIPVDWLLEGEPFIEYRTRLDLLGQSEQDAEVRAAREKMLADPRVQALIEELNQHPWAVIASHKSAGQPFHKLTFLADLGLKASDPGMDGIIGHILEHQSIEGPFQLSTNIPEHFGGSGQDQWAWALCDAPLLVYALVKFGLEQDPVVQRAVDYLTGLVRDNGWPCAVSPELGSWRGPGRREDPCPFATLAMLKLLAASAGTRESRAAHAGAAVMLALWEQSALRHPYIFYMGTDFRKLKAPFIWYDLLHVLEVLTQFSAFRQDARLLEMAQLLEAKADAQGRFTIESVWMAWKDWEFGQKKASSRWATFLAWRILKRMDGSNGQRP